jgi:PTS system N-acetylglucosamine-specific IIC component
MVNSQSAVDVEALKQLGARGVVRPSADALQVVVGTIADQVAGEIREALQAGADGAAPAAARDAGPTAVGSAGAAPTNPVEPAVPPTGAVRAATWSGDARELLAALGGRDNVRSVETAASRLRISVGDAARMDRAALGGLGLRGVAVPFPDCVHLIVGPAAAAAGAALRRVLTDN